MQFQLTVTIPDDQLPSDPANRAALEAESIPVPSNSEVQDDVAKLLGTVLQLGFGVETSIEVAE